ncbi:response regulator [Pontibacter sp. 172403-2]|nr:response regulator [Pontibacter sp. 172403-2]
MLFLLGTLSPVLAALPEQYRFSLIDINNGLSNNQVKCFLKDSNGYLWIGTFDGLNRYDGYKLKVFRYQSNDSSSIVGNDVLELFEGPGGEIWVKTPQGTCVFNPETEHFDRNPAGFLKQYGLPAGAGIEDILKDKDGNYWFILTGQGLTKYNPRTHTAVHLRHTFSDGNSLSTDYISAISQTARGDLWVVHRNGIFEKLDRKTLKVIARNDDIYRKYTREMQNYALVADSDNDLWLYVNDKESGAYFYDQSGKSLTHFHKNSRSLQLNNNVVRGIVEAAKGKIWIGTDHGGINVIDKKSLTVQYIRHNDESDKSLAHNSINTLYKDDAGIIWVGTFKKGINYYHKNIVRFPLVRHQASVSGSLPYDDVNSFVEDDKGNLWIGTNGGGLFYFDRATGVYTNYTHNPADPNSITGDIIVSLLIDKDKALWIGTYLGGLDRYDGKTFTHYRHQPENPESLSDNSVWELYEDTRGNIWAGTLRGGLELFDPQRNGFRHSRLGSGVYPVHCDYISSIAEDRHGNLWVAGGNGVDVFNKETGKSTYFSHDPKNPHSLVSNNVMYIHRDGQHNIWIGTTEGLELYNEKKGTFTHFTMEDGLPSNTVVTILEGAHNDLWLSTPNGVSNLVISGKAGSYKYSFRNYDERDGLQGKAFNENAALKTSKGEMIFGGPNGYNIFYPGKIEKNETAPRVVFTDFQLFNKSLKVNEVTNGRVILPTAISGLDNITLEHDENVFSVEFAALNFFHAEKNKYKYKLEGFDKDWHTVDNLNRKATYTNLDPGKYKFRVMASNNDGVWNKAGASMGIRVLAPFWQTKEALALYFILAIVALVLIRRIELHRARARFMLEQERREARQRHELDLMKINFFTNISHEFRTPLTLILAPIEKLLKTTTNPGEQQQYQMINKNAKRLLHMVNQLLDFKKMEGKVVGFSPSEGDVVAFVRETVHSFADLSDKKNIPLAFKSGVQELQVSFDRDKLEKILFNLLSNAFKFTPAHGRITVELNSFDNDSSSAGIKILELKVKDTGIGIAKENHKKVFERFYRDAVPGNLMNQGSGIGLAIVSEFVKIHGGMITVDSAPGVGSCFTVTIPVKEISPAPGMAAMEKYAERSDVEGAETAASRAGIKPEQTASGPNLPVVLVVEDNEDFRFYLRDSLKAYFTIIEAANGQEGWQKALSYLPDLIVSDLMMPELDGIDFCKKVKQDSRTSHIPFVLLTAHASEEKKLKGLDIGASDYVTKPVSFDLLHSRIRNLITQRELLQKVFERKISVQTCEKDIVSLDDKLIQKAIKHVEEHLSDTALSVEALSRELGVSRVQLYKKMMAITGQSPVEFIRKIRLRHAAQLLKKSQLTVAEVAYQVGFNNPKYFAKYFKEEYKILPSQYAGSKQEAKQV